MTDTKFYDSLWRWFPKAESFIKSKASGYNTRMEHVLLTYSLGFVNWYKPGLWGFNADSRSGLPVCSFEDSEFMEKLDADARQGTDDGDLQICSAAIGEADRNKLYEIQARMKTEFYLYKRKQR